MQIRELKLLNFRNYNKINVLFDTNLNIMYGQNGSGKTNLVEAIYVLALTRSFKQINDKTLIKKDASLTKIEGVMENKFQNCYKVIITNEGKKVKVDNTKVTKISDYISKINIVLFNPNDLKMIKDTPSIRRKYMNIAISQMNVAYLKNLSNYNKLLKIRNAYLKQMMVNGNSLNTYLQVITEKLIDLGMSIQAEREKYIVTMNQNLNTIYKKIAFQGDAMVNYRSDFKGKSKKELQELYKKILQKDISFGKTTIGVHHDDLDFFLDNLELKEYGSEGQQKNVVIAWKFSEIEIIKENNGVTPILILDDLLSELDTHKIKNILNLITEDIQAFITTTEIEKIVPLLENKQYKKFLISNGEIKEENE